MDCPSFRGWYDRKIREFFEIQDVTLIGAMGPPGVRALFSLRAPVLTPLERHQSANVSVGFCRWALGYTSWDPLIRVGG